MTRAPARSNLAAWALPALLLVAFFVRLLFVDNEGFKTDINTYVAWAIALSEHGFSSFYSSMGFADYPPGYFYVLAAVGRIWPLFFPAHDPGYAVMRMLVKLPAIFADLWVGVLLFAIVRRFAATGIALAAAAIYLLQPRDDLHLGFVGPSRLDLGRPGAARDLPAAAQRRCCSAVRRTRGTPRWAGSSARGSPLAIRC